MNIKFIYRWKYRFLYWFRDGPNSLNRRVEVENILLTAYKEKRDIPYTEYKALAMKLGVPQK